ncbi:ABC transporter permease subunit [Lysobacter pythonis]|uniref:ABC transporter permease subunit n=2 Tax=Solilutibacter pythonis TaxID=2483112 RepID=A0A3M2HP43_9GAMM|nr:ABC transporter permease subunit [Lysobacter pythonis]
MNAHDPRAQGAWSFWDEVVRNLFGWFRAVGTEFRTRRGRFLVTMLPVLWLLLFFAVPFLIVLKISFAEAVFGQSPPYTPLLETTAEGATSLRLHTSAYALLLQDPLYVAAYLKSLLFASVSTLLCLLLGYPIAYGIARARPVLRLLLLVLVILPFWTSSLLRTYAMIGILKANGLASQALAALGLIDPGGAILHTDLAVYIGIVYNYLPFMILPLTATLMRLDFTLLEAAADLGARPWQSFLRITLPLSMPGIIAGALLVFIPAVGEFVIPDILGGPDALTIGRVLWTEFFTNRDWPVASAVAIAMLLLIVIPTLLFEYFENRRAEREAHA